VPVIKVARLGKTTFGIKTQGEPAKFSRSGWVANSQKHPPVARSIRTIGTNPTTLKLMKKPNRFVPVVTGSLGIMYKAAKNVANVARMMLKRFM
jgi:hypothetical protein